MKKSRLTFVATLLVLSASATLAACNKEANTAVPSSSPSVVRTSANGNASSGTALRMPGGGPCKTYDEPTGNCPESQKDGCIEGDVHSTRKNQLELAISQGGPSIAELFSDNEIAVELIPHFNSESFSSIKASILSGKYNFDKVENANGTFYLLGPIGNINHTTPLYALKYHVIP